MKRKLLLCMIAVGVFGMQHAVAQNYMIIDDFEDPDGVTIPFNDMTGSDVVAEEEVYQVVANPDPDDVNSSEYVLQYNRGNDGVPWGGFWSQPFEPLPMDDMKYTHYQVWKPVISPLRFKVEGSDQTEDFEFESIEPQSETEGWETITFHYPDAAGEYPVIAVMPDFAESDELEVRDEEYISIYIDNIILSDSEEPPMATSAEQDEVPVQMALKQNYPNPFNPTTSISFSLPQQSHVTIEIFDVTGRLVETVVDEQKSAGSHSITWDASGNASGVYLYRLRAGSTTETKSMILMK